ncbi:MAG: acetyl-CoA hydrolase/transferase family protein [Chloroflexi bacterium]|nr:acetyl-CoA hydrolase/transferase family protein [Chloroflexota bacterium]
MDWQEEYCRKLVTPEEAVRHVKSADCVVVPVGREPLALGMALLARKDELRNVRVYIQTPHRDFPWYEPGWEDSFIIEIGFVMPVVSQMMQERRCDFTVGFLDFSFGPGAQDIDVLMMEVSPPDQHGFCSLGISIWNKKQQAERAKLVLAEVNKNTIRTYGDNFIHVSQIDYFVEHTPSGRPLQSHDLLGRSIEEAGGDERIKTIAGYVNSIIRDGDTVQVGAGRASEGLVVAGVFDGKQDLGWHSEATPRGVIPLIREGVINGSRKTLHRWKAVATAFGGGTPEDTQFIHMNPMFELYSVEHVDNVLTIAAHDNMVAMNEALMVDMTGQVNSETFGPMMYSGAGGQTAFALGAVLSKGGRSVTVLPSTARGGRVSRIVPLLPEGSVVTVPRNATDIVVSEYGIARLRGKTQRRRAEELIAIAHPDFRAELRKEAKRLFWP